MRREMTLLTYLFFVEISGIDDQEQHWLLSPYSAGDLDIKHQAPLKRVIFRGKV